MLMVMELGLGAVGCNDDLGRRNVGPVDAVDCIAATVVSDEWND